MTDQVNEAVAMWWDGDEHAITPRRKVQSCAADVAKFNTPLYTHPSRGVVDEAMVERACAAFVEEHGGFRVCRTKMRAALQAAALPAVPDGEKWHITEAWIHGGTVAELKLQRRFRGEDEAEVADLCGQYVRLAATPAHDQPEGADNG